jgi:magnesium transporter
MTPEYLAIHQDWTVKETLAFIRKSGGDKETINILYVLDDQDELIAYLKIRALIFENPKDSIRDIMNTQVIVLNAFDDQETASEAMMRYDLPVLPVVDSDGTLVGIVTSDDVLDVIVEETTEDIHKMGGMAALEEPYFHASFFTLIQKRAGWLFILFLGAMLIVTVMEQFDEIIQDFVVLTFFLPLVISSGGNSGTQAATLVIRALAVQDITLRDWFRVFLRELLTGLILGALLGGTILLRVWIWPPDRSPGGDLSVDFHQLAQIVTISVAAVVVCGTLIGSMLPFLLRALRFDPALSSTPLVTTLCDSIGVVIYYTLAMLML